MSISQDFSYVSSSDNTFIDGLYSEFKRNPDAIDQSWKQFFLGVEFALGKPEADPTTEFKGNLSKSF